MFHKYFHKATHALSRHIIIITIRVEWWFIS